MPDFGTIIALLVLLIGCIGTAGAAVWGLAVFLDRRFGAVYIKLDAISRDNGLRHAQTTNELHEVRERVGVVETKLTNHLSEHARKN
jgi:hypothetical protein